MSTASLQSEESIRCLSCVLDEIIPPATDGRLPGAGGLGLAEAFAARPELAPVLEPGLAALDEIAREGGAAGFADLAVDERRNVLDASAAKAPAWLPTLIAQTFVAYYQHPEVLEKLGVHVGAPFPDGFAVDPSDFAILDPVRRRTPFFRDPG